MCTMSTSLLSQLRRRKAHHTLLRLAARLLAYPQAATPAVGLLRSIRPSRIARLRYILQSWVRQEADIPLLVVAMAVPLCLLTALVPRLRACLLHRHIDRTAAKTQEAASTT